MRNNHTNILSSLLAALLLLLLQAPTAASYQCFVDKAELRKAVEDHQAFQEHGGSSTVVDTYGPIEDWCVDDVTDMSFLFCGVGDFDYDIRNWNVGKVTDMSFMFFYVSSVSSWYSWLLLILLHNQ